MVKLKADMHPKLSDDIIQILQRRNVSTVIEFVLEDSEILTKFSGLTHKDISELKQKIREKYGGVVKSAFNLLEVEENNIVPTDIRCLDILLNGGLYPGQIYEFCGISSSGKTQLCLSIASNVALRPNSLVRYIDTKRDFCGSRVEQILLAKHCNTKVIDETLERIKVCCVYKLGQFFKALDWLTTTLKEEKDEQRTRIIIIDSLPAIIFKCSNDHQINYTLNHLANVCRRIATEFKLPIVSVNLISQWSGSEETAGAGTSKNLNNPVPTLGKYWLRVPNTRLRIEKLGLEKRKITVWKSFQLEANLSTTLTISNLGIS